MRQRSRHPARKIYSARAMAAGSAFCPACRKLTDREAEVCPSCGFTGQHTMSMFPLAAPPLELISDHAALLSPEDDAAIRRAIRGMKRQFPQIHWRVVTASLEEGESPGLFAFWLLNVSPLGEDEEAESRPWTVLVLVLPDGEVALAPGYAVEVWLSGVAWGKLLKTLASQILSKGHGPAFSGFMEQSRKLLVKSWNTAKERTSKKHTVSRKGA